MADVKNIANHLAATIGNATGLSSFGYAPGQIVPPAVVVIPARPAIVYGKTMDGEVDISLLAICAVSAANDAYGQDVLLDYVSTSNPKSVYLAVALDPTLGGSCEFAIVTQVSQYGLIEYAGQSYMGATFLVQAGAHG